MKKYISGVYFKESQNQLGWKKPLGSLRPTCDQTPPYHLDRGTQCFVQSLNASRDGDSTTPQRSPFQCLIPFPNAQPKPALVQGKAKSCHSFPGEEAHPHLATTSCQDAVESESNFFGLVKRISVREQRLIEVIVHVWIDSYVVRIVSVHDALALQ